MTFYSAHIECLDGSYPLKVSWGNAMGLVHELAEMASENPPRARTVDWGAWEITLTGTELREFFKDLFASPTRAVRLRSGPPFLQDKIVFKTSEEFDESVRTSGRMIDSEFKPSPGEVVGKDLAQFIEPTAHYLVYAEEGV